MQYEIKAGRFPEDVLWGEDLSCRKGFNGGIGEK